MVLWFCWFLRFSGSRCSRGSLALVVLVVLCFSWFLWFSGSRGPLVLFLVLCVWLPSSTRSQIFSDGTTCGNLGVRDGMRAKSELKTWY